MAGLPQPELLSFDVFGTLVRSRDGSYGTFASILRDSGAADVDVKKFEEFWEARNIAHYWEPYRSYKQICEQSLAEAFAHFGVRGRIGILASAVARARYHDTAARERRADRHFAARFRGARFEEGYAHRIVRHRPTPATDE